MALFTALSAGASLLKGISGKRKARSAAKKQAEAELKAQTIRTNLATADDRREKIRLEDKKSMQDAALALQGISERAEAQLVLSEKGISGESFDTVLNNYARSNLTRQLISDEEFSNMMNEFALREENREFLEQINIENIEKIRKASSPSISFLDVAVPAATAFAQAGGTFGTKSPLEG